MTIIYFNGYRQFLANSTITIIMPKTGTSNPMPARVQNFSAKMINKQDYGVGLTVCALCSWHIRWPSAVFFALMKFWKFKATIFDCGMVSTQEPWYLLYHSVRLVNLVVRYFFPIQLYYWNFNTLAIRNTALCAPWATKGDGSLMPCSCICRVGACHQFYNWLCISETWSWGPSRWRKYTYGIFSILL